MAYQYPDNFQRKDAVSNAHVGKAFEQTIKKFFENQENIKLINNYELQIGVGNKKKPHKFDFGACKNKIIIECKSHTWRGKGDIPSSKITIWNEAMYYFHLAPNDYRKIFFCLKDYSKKKGITLAKYYIKTRSHLIPLRVEVWEYCEETKTAHKLYPHTK